MRQLSKTRQKLLFNDEEFEYITKNLKTKELTEYELWLKEQDSLNKKRKTPKELSEKDKINYKNTKKAQRRWIVCLNEEVARMDNFKREYFRKIIENKIEFSTAKEWIIKNGYRKYVNIKDLSIELNTDRLENDQLFDGKWCLITNTGLSSEELIFAYKDLASIERHFRDLKSELELGPIYHWTEKRIRAHIFVCFLALQLKVAFTKCLKDFNKDLSYSEVMRDVAKIKAVTFKIGEKIVTMRTELVDNANIAFKAVKTAIPPKIISTDVK